MRLVFIHGRAQEGRSSNGIREEWSQALHRGFEAAGLPAPDGLDIRAPFYGDLLQQLSSDDEATVDRVLERGDQAGGDLSEFEFEFLQELAERAGITPADITAELEQDVVERGPENWEWVHAIGRAIDRKLPWLSAKLMSLITADTEAYLTRASVKTRVHSVVMPHLLGEPTVVVGHSQGSIVGYCLLHELGVRAHVPLFVTVGSPLGMEVVKRNLPRPLGMPAGVNHWLNGSDERDPVALSARLDRDVFPAPIENLSDIHNPSEHPHGIGGYLADPIIAERIHGAVRS